MLLLLFVFLFLVVFFLFCFVFIYLFLSLLPLFLATMSLDCYFLVSFLLSDFPGVFFSERISGLVWFNLIPSIF